MTTLSIEERARTIERLIWEQDRVAVEELVPLFGTSAVTIRQDLTTLEAAGRVKRVRGGAARPTAPIGAPSTSGPGSSRNKKRRSPTGLRRSSRTATR